MFVKFHVRVVLRFRKGARGVEQLLMPVRPSTRSSVRFGFSMRVGMVGRVCDAVEDGLGDQVGIVGHRYVPTAG